MKRLSSLLPLPEQGEVLDLGCGIGAWSQFFTDQGWNCHGLDRNADFLAIGERRNGNSRAVRYIAGVSERLPFRDEQFDLCFARYMLEHVEDWRSTLREASRVLKPCGLLYVGTANILCPWQDEVRYMPFFPYLPNRLKRAVLRWVTAHRPALVNHSLTPAQHWFMPTGLRHFLLSECGFSDAFDSIDMVNDDDLAGRGRLTRTIVPALKNMPYVARNLFYVSRPSIVMVAVKAQRAKRVPEIAST